MSSMEYPHRNLTGWRWFKQYGLNRLCRVGLGEGNHRRLMLFVAACIDDIRSSDRDFVPDYHVDKLRSKREDFPISSEGERLKSLWLEWSLRRLSFVQNNGSLSEDRRVHLTVSSAAYYSMASALKESVKDWLDGDFLWRLVQMTFLAREGFLDGNMATEYMAKKYHKTPLHDAEMSVARVARCLMNPALPWMSVFNYPVVRRWAHANNSACFRVASTIRQEGCYEEVPALADALQDSGCDDRWMLDHSRQEHRHHPGCWLVRALALVP